MELKWDKSAKGAISQIKEKQYVDALKEYQGNLLLVGINYEKDTKTHTCVIEQVGNPHEVQQFTALRFVPVLQSSTFILGCKYTLKL